MCQWEIILKLSYFFSNSGKSPLLFFFFFGDFLCTSLLCLCVKKQVTLHLHVKLLVWQLLKTLPNTGIFFMPRKYPDEWLHHLAEDISHLLEPLTSQLLMSLLRGRGSAAWVCRGGMSHAVRIQLLHGSQVAAGCQVLPGGKLLGLEVKATRCTLIYST